MYSSPIGNGAITELWGVSQNKTDSRPLYIEVRQPVPSLLYLFSPEIYKSYLEAIFY